jgi:hypothetical protein
MKQCQRAIVRSITDKQTASAKCPGGKKIGLVLPGGQPLYTDKKNIGDKKKLRLEVIGFSLNAFIMSSMITTTAWVRRGVAAQFPTKYEIDEAEMNRISKLARMQLEDAKEGLSAAQDEAMDEDGKDGAAEATDDDSEKKTKEGADPK